MKHNLLIFQASLILLLSGCIIVATATPPAKTPPPLSAAFSPTPAEAVVPATAAPTNPQPLATRGPYYAYLRRTEARVELVLLDANGPGRKVIPLPAEVADPNADNSIQTMKISPDGKWLAFYTGSARNSPSGGNAVVDLSLNLVDLTSNTVRLIAHLLPPDYPQNFTKNAEDLKNQGVVESGITTDSLVLNLQDTFLAGIHSSAWSPDGRTLAFAGATDGPSSDTYLYDTNTQKITRLSSGPEEVMWLTWSPDGKWIMQESTWWLGEGMSFNIYASALDGSAVVSLSHSTTGIVSWLDDHTFLEYDGANGPGEFDLRSVDVRSGAILHLWKASFASYALDLTDGLLAVSGIPDPANWTGSLYLVNLASGVQTKIQDGVWRIEPFAVNGQSFFVQEQPAGGGEGKKYLLAADGTLTPTDILSGILSTAPSGKYWVYAESNQLMIYSPDNALIHTVDLPVDASETSDQLTWRADGSGLFATFYAGSLYDVSSYSLVSVDMAAGTAVLVDQGPTRLSPLVLVSGR
jgi:WD40 repeat protein